jgi:benzoyl-CoA reductase/2-hydroxyglutaryl-CoA dehydratase subunit BcrC/BadD/HgdB
VVAAGAIPLPLCGTRNDPIADAEKFLPRNLCPLIKSSFGFAATDTCPFFHFSDLLIAEQYLKIPCSCMSPNPERFELLGRLIKEFRVDGVVDLTWQACHTYNIESHVIKQRVEEEHGLPFLQIETDYSESDTERLRIRIEAFLEMMG